MPRKRLSEVSTGRSRRPVVLVVGPIPPPPGGIATQVELLLGSSLAHAFRLRHVNTAAPRQRLARRLLSMGGLVVRYQIALLTSWPSIVHLHSHSYGGFYERALLALIAKALGRRTILHLHGGGFQDFWRKSRLKRLIAWILRTVDVVIVLSEGWKQTVRRMSPQAHLLVVPTSVRVPARLGKRRASARCRLLFVGAIDRVKGIFDLVHATARAISGGVALELHMVGGGRDMAALQNLVRELDLTDVVTLSGFISDEERTKAYAEADVFVLPSYIEGLPAAVLEAMAAGLPVIATRVGAVPEVLADGECGELIDPGDPPALASCVVRLCEDHDLRRHRGEQGYKRVRSIYDVEQSATRLAAVYSSLLDHGVDEPRGSGAESGRHPAP